MSQLIIGITGGIGSGKTAVTDYLTSKGIDVVDADLASRVVVEAGRPALKHIEQHFGPELIQQDGTLDRATLREIIFTDNAARLWLEKLLHPLIAEEIQSQLRSSTSQYTVLASPLLLETNQYTMVDHIAVVDVDESVQRSRVSQRDGASDEQIKAIMAAQSPRQLRLSKADSVINNDGNLDKLHKQIETLHQQWNVQTK